MKPIFHPSERELGGPSDRPGAFIRSGQRCYCHNKSSSATSSATSAENLALQGQSRAVSGQDNQLVTDQGTAINAGADLVSGQKAGGDIAGFVKGDVNASAGGTVNITNTSNAEALANTFTAALTDVTQQASNLLGETINRQSDLAQQELATFTDATQAVKVGASQTTIMLGIGAVALVTGVWLYTRKK